MLVTEQRNIFWIDYHQTLVPTGSKTFGYRPVFHHHVRTFHLSNTLLYDFTVFSYCCDVTIPEMILVSNESLLYTLFILQKKKQHKLYRTENQARYFSVVELNCLEDIQRVNNFYSP